MNEGRILKTIATVIILQSSIALGQTTQNWNKASSHPAAKHLVAITWFSEADHQHGGNGVIVGPGGCYVMTNAHVAIGKENLLDSTDMFPKYGSDTEAFSDRDNFPLRISADLDPSTGRFRKTLTARLWNLEPLFFKPDFNTKNLLLRLVADVAIYRLDECMGEDFSIPVCDLPMEQAQPIGNLYNVHVWKTGAESGELYTQGPCQVDQTIKSNRVFESNCPSRKGMSGSIYISTDQNGVMCAAGQTSRGDNKVSQGILARAMKRLLVPTTLNRYAETHIPADKRPPMHTAGSSKSTSAGGNTGSTTSAR
jgi:hypothetical protein